MSRKNSKDPCSLYLISDGTAIKVGISKEPKARILELQTGNPRKLKLLWVHRFRTRIEAKRSESSLHRCLDAAKKNAPAGNEWYKLWCWDVWWVKRNAARFSRDTYKPQPRRNKRRHKAYAR